MEQIESEYMNMSPLNYRSSTVPAKALYWDNFDRLLQRMKYTQIMPTKIEMHRARFIRFLSNFATVLNNTKGAKLCSRF